MNPEPIITHIKESLAVHSPSTTVCVNILHTLKEISRLDRLFEFKIFYDKQFTTLSTEMYDWCRLHSSVKQNPEHLMIVQFCGIVLCPVRLIQHATTQAPSHVIHSPATLP